MSYPHSDSIEFSFKQTWFGIVLMVRDTLPSDSTGSFYWSSWRKAEFFELDIYMESKK